MLQDEDSHHLEWVRPPTDHGVDRPDVEAQQCVELTGTNRPRACHNTKQNTVLDKPSTKIMLRVHYTISQPTNTLVGFPPHPGCGMTTQECFGGHCARETPGPIPNPEAKPCSADGTAPEGVWESRTPPNTPQQGEQGAPHKRAGLLLVFPHKVAFPHKPVADALTSPHKAGPDIPIPTHAFNRPGGRVCGHSHTRPWLRRCDAQAARLGCRALALVRLPGALPCVGVSGRLVR